MIYNALKLGQLYNGKYHGFYQDLEKEGFSLHARGTFKQNTWSYSTSCCYACMWFSYKDKNNDKGQGNHCSGGKASAFREHVNGHQELCADYSRI